MIDLDKLREAERGMTEGPWWWEDPVELVRGNYSRCLQGALRPILRHEAETWTMNDADAEGIAQMRNAFPELLEEVGRLREEDRRGARDYGDLREDADELIKENIALRTENEALRGEAVEMEAKYEDFAQQLEDAGHNEETLRTEVEGLRAVLRKFGVDPDAKLYVPKKLKGSDEDFYDGY